MIQIFQVLNIVLLIISGVFVSYLFVFSVASRFSGKRSLAQKAIRNRFLILIPAYRAESVIEETVCAALKQKYEPELFDVLVISDTMPDETNRNIGEAGADVLKVNFVNSTKAQSLKAAVHYIEQKNREYDYVLILDADNIIYPDFLNAFEYTDPQRITAIQCHRMAKNTDTDIAMLDAISEEMNNSIYRQGHVNCHLPSALIGSAMLFSFSWFSKSVDSLNTVGEDKELELLLLYERKFIYYAADSFVLDEKVRKSSNFYNQRRRWIGAQLESFALARKYLRGALSPFNPGLLDKVFQWLIPPRIILMGGLLIWTVFVFILKLSGSSLWIVIDAALLLALLCAIPGKMYSFRLLKALCKIPYLFVLMLFNMFRLKNATKKFIHTNRNS